MHAVRCPKCSAKYEFEDADIGSSVTCECGSTVQLIAKNRSAKRRVVTPLFLVAAAATALISLGVYFLLRGRGNSDFPASQSAVAPSRPVATLAKPLPATTIQAAKEVVPVVPKNAMSVINQIGWANISSGLKWETISLGSDKEHLIGRDEVKAALERNVENGDEFLKYLIKKQPETLAHLLDGLLFSSGAEGFLDGPMVEFMREDDGTVCGCVLRLALSTEFNTNRMSERARAMEVFSKSCEGALLHMCSDMQTLGAKKIYVSVTYGVRDFSSDDKYSKSESLVVAANISDIEKFDKKQMSEDEFAKKCSIYLSAFTKTKKIELTFN